MIPTFTSGVASQSVFDYWKSVNWLQFRRSSRCTGLESAPLASDCPCRGISNAERMTYISSGPSDSALSHLKGCHIGSLHCHSLHCFYGQAKSASCCGCHTANCSLPAPPIPIWIRQVHSFPESWIPFHSLPFKKRVLVTQNKEPGWSCGSAPAGNAKPYVLHLQSWDVPGN